MAGARFGRNVPIGDTHGEQPPELYEPNPRQVSRDLLARRELRAGAASQRARPGLAAVHGARLAEPRRRRHHAPAAQDPAAAGRRLAGARHDDPAHAAGRPARPSETGPARDLSQHRDPLVGRLADLRLRPRAATPGAHRSRDRPGAAGRQDPSRCARSSADRRRPATTANLGARRRERQLVDRVVGPAHAVRARAQRDRGPAARRLPAPPTANGCSRRRGWSTPRSLPRSTPPSGRRR